LQTCERESVYTPDVNLILKYRLDAEAKCRVKRVARIVVDGDRLTLVEPRTGALEVLPLSRTEVLSIQSFSSARWGAQAS
jgi:hypothetical protein